MTRKMKDSGVEWIGEIPEDWEISKVGICYKQRNEKVSDLDYSPLSVTKNGIMQQLGNAAKSSNHNDRKLVKEGDFVINSRSDRKLSSGISVVEGSVSLINIVLFSNYINMKYTHYLFKNYAFAEEFYRWGTGIVADLWSTKWEKMKRISIPIPSQNQQQKIVDILDDKVGKIDKIISETQQSIKELKKYKQSVITEAVTKGLDKTVEMKNSGIEWIGEVPNHWNLKRIGNYFYQVKNKNTKLAETNLLSLSYGNVIRRDINSSEGLLPENFSGYNIIQADDIVLRMTDLQNDHKSLRTGYAIEKGIITSAYITIRTDFNEINSQYIQFLLHTFDIKKGFYGMGNGVRQNVNFDDIKKIPIAVPNRREQDTIVKFVVEKINHIDSIVQKKEQLILDLIGYKKSLIYEYVTGKKEVE